MQLVRSLFDFLLTLPKHHCGSSHVLESIILHVIRDFWIISLLRENQGDDYVGSENCRL